MANIETGEARIWTRDANAEINATLRTLNKVEEACENMPDKEDVVMNTIVRTAEFLREQYDNTCKTFKEAWESIEKGVDEFSNVVPVVEKLFDEFKQKNG